MTYSGRWHTEGDSENVVAAGVYYYHLGDSLEGGALKFRPQSAPQPDYGFDTGTKEGARRQTDRQTEGKESATKDWEKGTR